MPNSGRIFSHSYNRRISILPNPLLQEGHISTSIAPKTVYIHIHYSKILPKSLYPATSVRLVRTPAGWRVLRLAHAGTTDRRNRQSTDVGMRAQLGARS